MATCTARTTADASSAQLYVAPEECWGLDPTAVSPEPDYRELRFTSESLDGPIETVVSNEIRSDAQITDAVKVSESAGGDVSFEFSYRSFDMLLEGALRNDWGAELDVNSGGSPADARTVTIGSPLTEIEIPGSPGAELQVGQFIRVTGSTNSPSNDGYYRITAVNGDVFTVTPSFAGAETGTNLRVRASHLRNGTERKSFVLAKVFTDLSPQEILYFNGMRVGTFSLSIEPGSILTGSFSFAGKRGRAANTLPGLASAQDAPGTDVANAVDNIVEVLLDGSAIDADLTSISLDVNTNTRDKPAVAAVGNIDVGLGRFNVSGNLTMYFSSRVLYDKFVSQTRHSLSFVVQVGSDSYAIFLPSLKFSTSTIVIEGNDTDVVVSADFQALRDPTLGFTLGLDRFSDDIGNEIT